MTTKKANPPLPVAVMLAFLGVVLAALNPAHAQAPAAPVPPIVIDDFSDVSKWKVVASDGVEGKISLAEGTTCPEGTDGKSLRLDFDFKKGSGYCIVRRELDLVVPENYRVSYWLSGYSTAETGGRRPGGFVNDLEFKFYDQTGDNVWWVRRAKHAYKESWQRERSLKREIQFAWGPGGGRVPLERVKAIEFAVTASASDDGAGRKGYVLIDALKLEPLQATSKTPGEAIVRVNGVQAALMKDSATQQIKLSKVTDGTSTLEIDFGAPHEFGGVLIEWMGSPSVRSVVGSVSASGDDFEAWKISTPSHDHVWLATSDAGEVSASRLVFVNEGKDPPIIKHLWLLPQDAAKSANTRTRFLAAISSPGDYPRMFLDEQVTWSPFGSIDSEFEGLLSGDGQVEMSKGGRTIEPFVWINATGVDLSYLIGWREFTAESSLEEGRLPLPRVRLKVWGSPLTLDVQPFILTHKGEDVEAVRYRLSNPTGEKAFAKLILAMRPFQALPPWHTLNMVGGAIEDPVEPKSLAHEGVSAVTIGSDAMIACTPAEIVALAGPDTYNVVQLAQDGGTRADHRYGKADSGMIVFECDLGPGEHLDRWIRLDTNARGRAWTPLPAIPPAELEAAAAETISDWRTRLHQITLKLPPQAKELEDSFYAQIGWILVNKDGPAIQPGSRTYDRTWIRDGSLTATALLYTGHADEVKEFLDWFRTFQYEGGKIPCCVDERGPDPVPEHDSHGQYIYGVATYHRFTHDDDLLKRHWGNVAAAVGYIEKLRATRMTSAYSDPNAPAETRVKFGLVPESISHEGYSAKPMHSYWDDFFTLRGLTDAVYIAEKLGQNEQAAKWAVLRDDFQRTLIDSIRLAQKIKNITFVPGCAELGDYDPTSTAAALFPGGQADGPLGDSLRATFDRYIGWFRDRRDGRIEWKDYTPYEMRNASALLMLGHADQSHEVLDWMLSERASIGWREWAEIGYKDKKAGKFVGDMPHTWVGSDYVKAVRNLCVYERERDHALVVGAGLKPEWLQAEGGVTIGNFPTEFGTLSYTASMKNGVIAFDIEAGTVSVPAGGVVVMPMIIGKMGTVTVNGAAAKETGDGFVTLRTLPAKVRIEVK
jgi:hypothetical protein